MGESSDRLIRSLDNQVRSRRRKGDISASEVETLRRTYQRLKQNYEKKSVYMEAEDFYFGEMEMTRLRLKPLRRYFLSWEYAYWLVSGYGTRWQNSIAFLLVTCFFFPLLFLFTGIEAVGHFGLSNHYIEYDLSFSFPRINNVLMDYWDAIKYNILSVFYMRDSAIYYIATVETRLFQAIEIVLIPIFATLFVLALRRKFKH